MSGPDKRHGHFHWNELMTPDAAAARDFYTATLGWTYVDMPMESGTYTVIVDGEEPVGGIMPMGPDMAEAPVGWFAYIAVDDVDARVAKVTAAGGTLLRPCFDVDGIGRFAIIMDPSGGAVGLVTPA